MAEILIPRTRKILKRVPSVNKEHSIIFWEVEKELERARTKFPAPNLLVTAFAEEAGEVIKAVLDHCAAKGKLVEVKKEIVQCMAMCIRLLEEGDPIHGLPPSLDE